MSTLPAGTCDCSSEGKDNISFQVAFLIGAVAFVVGVLLTLLLTMLRQCCKDKGNSYPVQQHHQGDQQQQMQHITSRRARGLDYNDFGGTPKHTSSLPSPSMIPEEDEDDPDTMFVKSAISRANSARQALLQQSMRNESFESELNLGESQDSESSSSSYNNNRSSSNNNNNTNSYTSTKSTRPTHRNNNNTTRITTSSFNDQHEHQHQHQHQHEPESRKGSLSRYKPKNTVIEFTSNIDDDVEEV